MSTYTELKPNERKELRKHLGSFLETIMLNVKWQRIDPIKAAEFFVETQRSIGEDADSYLDKEIKLKERVDSFKSKYQYGK